MSTTVDMFIQLLLDIPDHPLRNTLAGPFLNLC